MMASKEPPALDKQDPSVQETIITDDLTTDWDQTVLNSGGTGNSKTTTLPHSVCTVEDLDVGDDVKMAYLAPEGLLVVDVRGDTLGGD